MSVKGKATSNGGQLRSEPPAVTEGMPDAEEKKVSSQMTKLFLKINETPAWYLCILLGFQHIITMLGGTVTYPYILGPRLCMRENDPSRAYIIATTLFCSGAATLLQTTLGVRLPIVQGATFAFFVPTLAILNLPQWECPSEAELISSRDRNSSLRFLSYVTESEYQEVWQVRMREVQGAIIAGSLVEVAIGVTGIMGVLLRYITPLSIVPTVSLIGLTLFKEAATPAGESWLVSGLTMGLMVLFSQYIVNGYILIPSYNKAKGLHVKKVNVVRMFPVLLTLTIVWTFCGFMTLTDMWPQRHAGRTDSSLQRLVRDSPWVRVPYPFQWGLPTFSASAILGMMAGFIASAVESVGDYLACARLCEAQRPPTHAVNRGIWIEGISCMISGVMGSGGGLTSYSENVGAIGITKVASRRVVQVAALLMIGISLMVKFSAIFATIPVPIIGGILCIMFSIITAVGLSSLQFVDLNSSRNQFILGISLFMGICVPKWLADNPNAVQTGSDSIDQILTVLLSTGMFVGGFLGFFLDNTMPGSDEERGLTKWLSSQRQTEAAADTSLKSLYDLPGGLGLLVRRFKLFRFLPISPTYSEEEVATKISKMFVKKSAKNGNIDTTTPHSSGSSA